MRGTLGLGASKATAAPAGGSAGENSGYPVT
jgi:hypothetical protein